MKCLGWLSIGCLLLSAPAWGEVVLYDNGPVNGAITAEAIYAGQAISDSFTLTNSSVLTGVTFGDWSGTGGTPTGVQWGISASIGGSDLGGGDAGPSSVFVTDSPDDLYFVYDSTFSLPDISLGPGTYYLTLQNAYLQYWDVNDGPSAAYNGPADNLANTAVPGTDSESFQILGTETPEPNPGPVVAGLFACAAAAGFIRKRRGGLASR